MQTPITQIVQHVAPVRGIGALMPFTAQLLEEIQHEAAIHDAAVRDLDYHGEQFAPKCSGASVTAADSPDPIFALQGQPRLVAIAQIDRSLALTVNRLIDQLVEGDFSEAAPTADELSHRIRTHYLASLSDAAGVAKR